MSILMAFRHLIISSNFAKGETRIFQGRGGGTKGKGDIPKKRKGFSETNNNPTEKMNNFFRQGSYLPKIPPRNTYYYANPY